MNNLRRRVLLVAAAFATVLAGGTAGFMIIERAPLLDSFYMTLITVTTIGYGEIFPLSTAGRIYNSLLILGGVTTILLATGMMTQTVIELELNNVFRKRRQKKMIDLLSEHVIVCGFGRVGRGATEELEREGIPFVVVDHNEDRIERAMHQGLLGVVADASQDETLRELGIAKARGLIATLGSDADNLFLTMTARTLNSRLQICVRIAEESAEDKMRRAGATHVFAPYNSTGHRMAQALVKPHVMQFVDFTAGKGTGLSVDMEQVEVKPSYPHCNKLFRDAQIQSSTGVIVLAIRKTQGQMIFNPPEEARIESGDVVIAMGEKEGLRLLTELLSGRAL